jgi:hypothetical protein
MVVELFWLFIALMGKTATRPLPLWFPWRNCARTLLYYCGIVPRKYQDCSRVLVISQPKLHTKPTKYGVDMQRPREVPMNKLLAVMMVAVLPALALGSDDTVSTAQTHALKPVITIIDLTPEQVQKLEKVHGDYQAQKTVLDAQYNAKINALIEIKATLNAELSSAKNDALAMR